MIKKMLVTSLALVGLVLSQPPMNCFADTLDQAKQNVISFIETRDFTNADAATAKLIADFSGKPSFDEAIHQIALKHQEVKNYQKEIELSRYIITNLPDSYNAVWAQLDIVMANLYLRNETAAQTEIGVLINRYKDNPALPRMISIIGLEYRKEGFGQILKQNFNSESPAGIRLAILDADTMLKIESKDYTAAGQNVDKMIADFSSDPDLPEILSPIAQQFVWWHQYEQAGNIYKQIAEKFPTSPYAYKAKKSINKTGQVAGLISSLIEKNDYSKVSNVVNELINNFGDEPDTPSAIYDIAVKLEEAGKYALARQVYEQLVWRYADSKHADMAKLAVPRTKLLAFDETGDETSANSIFDAMLQDFKDHSYLPSSVILTAEGYYRRSQKTKEKDETFPANRLINKTMQTANIVKARWPNSIEVPNALFLVGECHYQLKDYQKSADIFQQVVDGYPNSEMAVNALFMVAESYRTLKETGGVSQSEADLKIRSAYEQLLQKYPNSPLVDSAQRWLNKNPSR